VCVGSSVVIAVSASLWTVPTVDPCSADLRLRTSFNSIKLRGAFDAAIASIAAADEEMLDAAAHSRVVLVRQPRIELRTCSSKPWYSIVSSLVFAASFNLRASSSSTPACIGKAGGVSHHLCGPPGMTQEAPSSVERSPGTLSRW
jgi:hypothetical protein